MKQEFDIEYLQEYEQIVETTSEHETFLEAAWGTPSANTRISLPNQRRVNRGFDFVNCVVKQLKCLVGITGFLYMNYPNESEHNLFR